jgi:tetratricopeptide (TPR) repeat protein
MSFLKNKGKLLQVLLIISSISVFLLLYFLPKNYSITKIKEEQKVETKNDISRQINEVKKELDSTSLIKLTGFETLYSTTQGSIKISYLDSIIRFWDIQMRPAIAAIYAEEKATLVNTDDMWLESGNRYLQMASLLEEKDKAWAYQRGKEVFEKIIAQSPDNTDAKIGLGVCIVESGLGSPMEGITLIRQVLEKDPNNLKAILQLGHFSVFSGQFAKAVERYKQAIQINPELDEAYFYLGDTFAKMGETDSAVAYLNRYKNMQQEPVVIEKITEYINEIKTKSNN